MAKYKKLKMEKTKNTDSVKTGSGLKGKKTKHGTSILTPQ